LVSEWLDGAESFLIYWLSVNWLRRDLVLWKPSFITVFEKKPVTGLYYEPVEFIAYSLCSF